MIAGTAIAAIRLIPIGAPTIVPNCHNIFFLRLHGFLPQNVQPDGLQVTIEKSMCNQDNNKLQSHSTRAITNIKVNHNHIVLVTLQTLQSITITLYLCYYKHYSKLQSHFTYAFTNITVNYIHLYSCYTNITVNYNHIVLVILQTLQ